MGLEPQDSGLIIFLLSRLLSTRSDLGLVGLGPQLDSNPLDLDKRSVLMLINFKGIPSG